MTAENRIKERLKTDQLDMEERGGRTLRDDIESMLEEYDRMFRMLERAIARHGSYFGQ